MANKKYLTEEEKKESRRLTVKKYNDKVKEKKKKHYEENKKLYSEKSAKYYQENKEKVKEKVKEYSEKNKEKITESKRIYYQENKEIINQKNKNYLSNNREWYDNYKKYYSNIRNEKRRNRRKNDNLYNMKFIMRNIIWRTLKYNGYKKSLKTNEILGCSYNELCSYLESKFENWMNWENRGLYNGKINYGWDIDHIIPLSSAKTEEELIKLNHYTNLQPLCSHINRDIKKNKLDF